MSMSPQKLNRRSSTRKSIVIVQTPGNEKAELIAKATHWDLKRSNIVSAFDALAVGTSIEKVMQSDEAPYGQIWADIISQPEGSQVSITSLTEYNKQYPDQPLVLRKRSK